MSSVSGIKVCEWFLLQLCSLVSLGSASAVIGKRFDRIDPLGQANWQA
jgi:hypothetical protein